MREDAGHPVVSELERHVRSLPDPRGAEETVLAHGRPFVGSARPKGYALMAIKKCFANAGRLALDGRGIYVEGFALTGTSGFPFHHAWITLDGTDAIDVTLRGATTTVAYFGIPFSTEVLRRWIAETDYWGPLLDADRPMEELMEDASRHPPEFH
jgi:hypothetical protein